jgi:DNA-binding GntR family transcriptional regulator
MSVSVSEYVRRLVYDGSLTAGQRVPQEEIATQLSVSRLPVREALISLENEGLVASEPHRGVFVLPISRDDIRDHYEIYGMIQGLAASRAIDVLTEDDLQVLSDLHARMSAAPGHDTTVELNWQFHALITRRGASRKIKTMLRQMAHKIPREIYELQTASPEANEGHAQIRRALREGDRAGVERAIREHMRLEGAYVIDLLDRRGVLSD